VNGQGNAVGAIHATDSKVDLVNSNFQHNEGDVGALAVYRSESSVYSCEFSGNTAKANGGAIFYG